MAKDRNRRRHTQVTEATPFDQARDEMFQHIMRCGVIGADPAHQSEWFNDTLGYLQDRFHELSKDQLRDLRVLGERFCQPAKGKQADASEASESNETAESNEQGESSEQTETAGAASGA